MSMEAKQQIRRQAKAQRQALSENQAAQWSRQIARRLLESLDWPKIRTLHTFLPIKQFAEVDTFLILRQIWQQHPNVATYTFAASPDHYLATAEINDATPLAENQRGIPEPVGGPIAEMPSFDVILVPLLAFDPHLNRIGFGEGYYDRFLADHPQAKFVGLAYEMSKVELIEREPHDQTLHTIITEQKIY